MVPPTNLDCLRANHSPRWRFLVLGLYLWGFLPALGAVSLFSGCGDDKSQIAHVENAPNPADKAKDSMDFYKGGAAKKGGSKLK
jgi:hypothetical protein